MTRRRMILELTPEERAVIEDVRQTLGARSNIEVIRHWIKLAQRQPKEPK